MELLTAPGPALPNSKKRPLWGSYQILTPVESTDDILSHPFEPMWSSIQQSTNATLPQACGSANGCHGRPRVTVWGAMEGDSFFRRLRKKRNP